MWEFLSQNLRNKISVTDFFSRIWRIAQDKHQFKIGIMADLIFMFRAKRSVYLRRMSDIDETAETGVSDERGRKTAELHTSQMS